jgi:tyrosine-protein kinase Etk/Wzc
MNHSLQTSPISYFKLLKVVLSRWYWLLFALSCGYVSCYLYLFFTPKEYRSSASLKYEDKKSEISELISVRNLYDRTNKAESEKNTILSRAVLSAAIGGLDYQIIFFEQVNMRTSFIYPKKPIAITFLKRNTLNLIKHSFRYTRLNRKQYQLCLKSKGSSYCNIYVYNRPVSILGNVIVIRNTEGNEARKPVLFSITNPDEVIETIQKGIRIDDSQNTNTLKLKYVGNNAAFCTDILNSILDQYLKFDVRQKEDALTQTSNFLSLLIGEMSNKADSSASALQSFKESNNLLNVTSLATTSHEVLDRYEMAMHTINMNLKVLRFVSARLDEEPSKDIATYNLQGLPDTQLQGLVEKYQQLILTRREKLNVYTIDSGPIQFLNDQIKDLKNSIVKSLLEHQRLNEQRLDFLLEQADSVTGILKKIPKIETEANSLSSRSELDQKVREFLAQKKLETQIVNAAIIPIATILDRAVYPIEQWRPIAQSCYLLSTIISIIAGTFTIIAIHLYNPFIYTKEHIEQLTSLPILGVVNKSYDNAQSSGNQIILKDFPRSTFSESIRFIRGNLNFIAHDKGKVICITSAVSGEGKSFVSLNLAYALTLIQKKVILIAADLRKSALHSAFGLANSNGLSKYLSGQSDVASICIKTSVTDLDVITAGPTPPNPSELLHSHLMVSLLQELKQSYDIILIDSAPIGLVSDIKPVMKIADINLFVLRSGVSKPDYTLMFQNLQVELNLSSVAIILNDYKSDNFHNHYYKDSR